MIIKLLNRNVAIGDESREAIHNWEATDETVNVVELDRPITIGEVEEGIKKLKLGKASGFNGVINEFFKYEGHQVNEFLCNLFNKTLDLEYFLETWAVGTIIPIYKGGDKNDPENYRGITLICCLGKLFTNIINIRLSIWAENKNIFGEEQYSFRKSRGTADCIFILHGIIEYFLSKKKKIELCFSRLQKSFRLYRKRSRMV